MSPTSTFGPFTLDAAAAATLLLKVTLVLGAAWALAALLRRRSAAARHYVWTTALVATLALVALGPFAPAIDLPWMPAALEAATAAGEPIAPPPEADSSRAGANEPRAAGAGPLRTVPPHKPTRLVVGKARSLDALTWPGFLWAAGAAGILLWCVAGHLGLRRLARAAAPLGGAEWAALLAETAASAGVRSKIDLRASSAFGTPVTWGAWRPIVILPADAGSWPIERRRAALLHELAHVARHDYLWQLAGTAACALYWFHPAAWLAMRRLRLESERACDDRVLASGTSAAEYAAELLAVARGAGRLRAAGAALAIGMARPSTLEGRLLAVLDESVPRRTLPARLRLAAGMATALVIVPFAGLTPVARGEVAAATVAATTVSGGHAPEVSVGASGGGVVGVSVAAPVVATSGSGKDWRPEAPPADPAKAIEESVAAAPGEELFLDLETGAGVAISSWDEPRVEVRGQLGGRDWRDSRVDVGRGAGGVVVRIASERRSGNHSTSHRLAIRVPRRFDVRLRSSGGDLEVDGVEGSFEGTTGGGDLVLTNLRGSARLSTGGGTIRVADCTLDGKVTTGGGRVTLSRVSGGLRGTSGSGPVIYREPSEADGDEGATGSLEDLDLDGDDDDIDLRGLVDDVPAATGRLNISRAGGDVRLAGAPDGAVIHTGGGEILVGRSAGLVDARTGGGDVEIGPVAGSVRAVTGAGRVEVTLIDAGGEAQSVEISSGNGTVLVVLPAGFDGTIDLETAYTERHGPTRISAPWELRRETTDWESTHGTRRRFVRARGTAGNGGGGHVRVRTVNGDIEVHER